jgi:hypothetical protein
LAEPLPAVVELFSSGDELFPASVERSTTITDTHLSYLSANLATSFFLVVGSPVLEGVRVLGASRVGDMGDWRESTEFFPATTGIFEELSGL